jgi:hypothetical protein
VARVGPGQEKELVDDPGQPPGRVAHHLDRAAILGLGPLFAGKGHLGLGPEDGRRGPELVRRVRHQPSLLGEGPLQAVEQVVHHRRQADELLTAADGKPLVEVGRRDARRLTAHRRHRRQAPPGQLIAADRGAEHEERHRDQRQVPDPLPEVLDVGQRIRSDQPEPLPVEQERAGDDPVRPGPGRDGNR